MSQNEAQSVAIAHKDGPMLVLAGPGSGKTHVITNRIANLIDKEDVKPEEILVITFTKLAATEMKERFLKNYKREVPVSFGTFHGIFYGILRWAYNINANNIMSDFDKKKMLTEIIDSVELENIIDIDVDMEEDFLENIIKEISILKGENIPLVNYQPNNIKKETFIAIYKEYELKRKRVKKLDFDDMIGQCYKLLVKDEKIRRQWQERYKYILIDEFQDINKLQFETIKLLAGHRKNLFIVGDDDQSIYGFRGAKPEIMLNFKKEFPDTKEVLLKINYRSTVTIVNGAGKVIKNNVERFNKTITTINEQGDNIHIQECKDVEEESGYILSQIRNEINKGRKYSDISVIYRTNLDAKSIAATLVRANVPFQIKDKVPNIYDHFIAKNIITYMNLTLGKMSRANIMEIINRPNRYVKRTALDNLEPTLEALRESYKDVDYMWDRISQLEVDLRVMKNLTPFAFIEYLRTKVGYNDYLAAHAEYFKTDLEELKEKLNEIQEQSKEFKTLESWLEFIDDYKLKLREMVQKQDPNENAVRLHTMHGSKGLEFDTVFILTCNEEVTPSKKAEMPKEIEEERRMFYVAMTRAKKKLVLSYVKERNGKSMRPSRFVSELLI